jgi:hypothetical protein
MRPKIRLTKPEMSAAVMPTILSHFQRWHRLAPPNVSELSLLYTAYFDESDTHGPAPTVIMACVLGHSRQWELFGRRLRRLQRRDGFRIFHATEFRSKSDDFSGWSDTKCMQLVHDLTELVRDNLTEGVTMFLERERYLNEYRKPPIPKKMMLDSQYGVCFRACMAHLVAIVMADGKRHKINAVIEDGHPNVGDTIRIFSDMKRQVKQRLGIDLFGTISKAKKWQSPPLMVCDFLSYSYLKMRASKAKGDMDYAAEASMDPRKKEAGLTFLELLPDALRGLKDKFEKDRQEAAEAWRARRAAMKRHS